jgi:hypothetical protein
MPSVIKDGRFGTSYEAGVTPRGQLVVAPLEFNTAHKNTIVLVATAYNFITPIAGKQFVISGYIASSDKSVSATDGVEIDIFEAAAVDTTTSSKDLITIDLARLDKDNAIGLNLITTPGVWINAAADDTNVNLTLLGYYVDVITA